jgi:hypothetical protein
MADENPISDNSEYIKKLEKYAESLRLVKSYSIQRIDLLVISLSGAGIYTCFETMKYIDKIDTLKNYPSIYTPFKISGGMFILSIVCNVISQWSSYKGSSIALKSTLKTIYAEENGQDCDDETNKLDAKAGRYNNFTDPVNIFSIVLMIAGLVVLTTYLLNLF